MGLIQFQIYHGGSFYANPEMHYKGGKVSDLQPIESDLFTIEELENIVKGLCVKPLTKYHFRVPGKSLKDGVRLCWSESFNALIELAKAHSCIELYVEHEDTLVDLFESITEDFDFFGKRGVNSDDDEVASLEHVSEDDEEVVLCREKNLEYLEKKTKKKLKRKAKAKQIEGALLSEENAAEISEIQAKLNGQQSNADENINSEARNERNKEQDEDELDGSEVEDFLEEIRSCSKSIDPNEYVSDYEDSDIDFDDPRIDSDDESAKPIPSSLKWPVFDPKTKWKFQEPSKGMLFRNTADLRHCIINYAVANGREIWFEKMASNEVLAKCKVGCPWRCFASPLQMENTIQVKSYNSEHCPRMCVLNFKVKLVTSSWLAREYKSKIRKNPKWDLYEFQEAVKTKYGMIVSLVQCYKARAIGLAEVEAVLVEHYGKLWDYREELLRSNPGSTIVLEGKDSEDGKTKLFDRMYICFDALKRGWAAGCRPVIGLDGCFLKSFVAGQLLCAVGRDGNNHMYPIAWAVVQVESTETWTWFMNLLKQDLGNVDGFGLTFISDEQKLNASKANFKNWDARNNGQGGFEVRKGLNGYSVNLVNRTCTCRMWQLSGVPCSHAVCAIAYSNEDCDLFVNEVLTVSHSLKAYAYALQPVNGQNMWPRSDKEPLLPPIKRRGMGRPRKERYKEWGETKRRYTRKTTTAVNEPKNSHEVSRVGRQMRCTNCNDWKHTARSCKNPRVEGDPELDKRRKRQRKRKPSVVNEGDVEEPDIMDTEGVGLEAPGLEDMEESPSFQAQLSEASHKSPVEEAVEVATVVGAKHAKPRRKKLLVKKKSLSSILEIPISVTAPMASQEKLYESQEQLPSQVPSQDKVKGKGTQVQTVKGKGKPKEKEIQKFIEKAKAAVKVEGMRSSARIESNTWDKASAAYQELNEGVVELGSDSE